MSSKDKASMANETNIAGSNQKDKPVDSQPYKDQSMGHNLPVAKVITQGSTALEGVGTNPTGREVNTNPGNPTTTDKASGAIDKAIGKVKEQVGKIVGSESILENGKDQIAEGQARIHGESYERQRKL
ncbi:204_t:CDS:2 [Ambispora gerdemannii]|uniref:204_t:CDS:1 n=1 Tax=Ambispora gerdemannii TaxID=144530 RepID=A0A9N8VX19_9GLOM|nr:204_t:CDS:2 [Ambispora gerdemannii]